MKESEKDVNLDKLEEIINLSKEKEEEKKKYLSDLV